MTRPSTPPAHTDFSRLLDRVDKLERKYTPRGPSRLGDLDDVDDVFPIPGGVVTYDETLGGYKLTAGTGNPLVTFSYPGTVETGVESPPWYPLAAITFTTVRLSRLAAGGSDLVIDVNVNGSTITTVTLTAGNATVTDATTPIVVAAEPVTVTVNDAGDAENVSVELF